MNKFQDEMRHNSFKIVFKKSWENEQTNMDLYTTHPFGVLNVPYVQIHNDCHILFEYEALQSPEKKI